MARTVKEHEYAEKRSLILDATLRLVFAKGYERMTMGRSGFSVCSLIRSMKASNTAGFESK